MSSLKVIKSGIKSSSRGESKDKQETITPSAKSGKAVPHVRGFPSELRSLLMSSTGPKPTSKPYLLRSDEKEFCLDEERLAMLTLMKPSMGGILAKKIWPLTIGTNFNMSSSGAGLINNVIACSSLSLTAEFISCATLFDEYFIKSIDVEWQPVSRFTGPTGYAVGVGASSQPIYLASLHHNAVAYTSLATMASALTLKSAQTADPFKYSWVNVENSKSGTFDISSNTQGWTLCTSGATYGGYVQILGSTAVPNLPNNAVLGSFTVLYRVLFRCRA